MALSEQGQTQLIYALRFFGFAVGAAVVALGFYAIISGGDTDVRPVVLDLYRIIFGLLIMLAELRMKRLLVWFSFLLYYIGLGLFYVFVGGLTAGDSWGDQWYAWVIAIIAVAIGCTYCAVGCLCSDVEKRQSHQLKADVVAAQM